MLFNEPKLLKFDLSDNLRRAVDCFSALQRAEIAEIGSFNRSPTTCCPRFSALQRAEIAEIRTYKKRRKRRFCFSALQRAEIAEIVGSPTPSSISATGFSALQRAEIAEIYEFSTSDDGDERVSVLFNEPKLLKSALDGASLMASFQVSVLFNEPKLLKWGSE